MIFFPSAKYDEWKPAFRLTNGGLTRNDMYDTICKTLIRFLYDTTNQNV